MNGIKAWVTAASEEEDRLMQDTTIRGECCSWEMSDTNHSIPDKEAGPVRINANKSGIWGAERSRMPSIESNFYILERQPSDNIGCGGNRGKDRETGIESVLLNWSSVLCLTIRHLKADSGWQFSNVVSGSCGGCQEIQDPRQCLGPQHWDPLRSVCIICSELPPRAVRRSADRPGS